MEFNKIPAARARNWKPCQPKNGANKNVRQIQLIDTLPEAPVKLTKTRKQTQKTKEVLLAENEDYEIKVVQYERTIKEQKIMLMRFKAKLIEAKKGQSESKFAENNRKRRNESSTRNVKTQTKALKMIQKQSQTEMNRSTLSTQTEPLIMEQPQL